MANRVFNLGSGSATNNLVALKSIKLERRNASSESATDPARQGDAAGGERIPCPYNACEGISAKERERFLRVVEASQSIARHQDLQLWLQGEMQHFIRHEVLISAHGCFATWQTEFDVISSLPGVRTQLLAQCGIDDLVKALFQRWVKNARQPYVLHWLEDLSKSDLKCQCALHAALRNAKSVLVHGVRDERGDCDSLYVALHSTAITKGCLSGCFRGAPCFLIDSLITQIDTAARKVASLPIAATAKKASPNGVCAKLSEREREIMEWICRGKTNFETGIILDISNFTVKNHVQRIFQKIGANNRVHAVTLYREQFAKLENKQFTKPANQL